MMISELEPAYEAARLWALHPVGRPPPGWAHMVRYGLASWSRERRSPVRDVAPQESLLKRSDCSPLLIIVAAMIAEVCQ
jgi:hypothetical protein